MKLYVDKKPRSCLSCPLFEDSECHLDGLYTGKNNLFFCPLNSLTELLDNIFNSFEYLACNQKCYYSKMTGEQVVAQYNLKLQDLRDKYNVPLDKKLS